MAAPKKCKSLMKRRVAHGNKIKSPHARSFNGISINPCNVIKCSMCQQIILSHRHCYTCLLKEIKSYK